MRDEQDLYPEDLERVKKVTSSGIHSVDRKPFKPWKMIVLVMVVLAVLMTISQIIAKVVGVI
jgi:hypothetical protein